MNYYSHNIGDYKADTEHLTFIEHGAYRKLLDFYYTHEKPLPIDDAKLMRLLCVRNAEEEDAVRNVLEDFFTATECGYKHNRCDVEIEKYHAKSTTASTSAKARWANKINDLDDCSEDDANAMRTQCERYANQEPITKRERTPKPARGTRLPKDWVPDSDEYMAFCKNARPDLDFLEMVDKFRDYWCSKPGKDGTKLDWLMTWRNFIRQERGFSHKATNGSSVAKLERDAI